MAEIRQRAGIKAEAAQFFELLTTDCGLQRWWTGDTRSAGPIDSVIEFRFAESGPDFGVIELIQNRRKRWRHRGKIPPAWMGSGLCSKSTPTKSRPLSISAIITGHRRMLFWPIAAPSGACS